MDRKGPDSASVYEVIGEPAIVINGVPPLPCESAASFQVHTMVDTGGHSDPGFGDWLEGREIKKLFGDQYYSGKIEKYDQEENWYRIAYEDGDFEDLEWRELAEVLVPVDISVPLTALALQRCKTVGETSIPSIPETSLARKKRGRPRSLGNTEKTLDVCQSSDKSKLVAEKSQELVSNTRENLQHDLLNIESGDNISNPENTVGERQKDTSRLRSDPGVESVKLMELLPLPCQAELTGPIPVQVLLNEEIATGEISKRQK